MLNSGYMTVISLTFSCGISCWLHAEHLIEQLGLFHSTLLPYSPWSLGAYHFLHDLETF